MLTGWRLSLSKLFLIPQRYVLTILGMFAVGIAYTMRMCLNMAITQMVRKTTAVEGDAHYDPNACPDPSVTDAVSNITEEYIFRVDEPIYFEWSEATQGLLLGAFYYGYVLTHIPGGMLADRFGGKWVLGLGLLSTAICSVITPMAVTYGGATALFILRVIQGLGEGLTMPSLMAMLSRWTPKEERAKFGAMVFGGAPMGHLAGNTISGLVMHEDGWENVFYVFGALGIAWFFLWSVLCYSTPNTHPFISDAEKKFLNENVETLINSKNHQKLDPIPWKAVVRSVPLWALIIVAIGHDWGYYTMVTNLPEYMTDVLKYDIESSDVLAGLPYLAMFNASFLFSGVCDFCIKKGYHSILSARKIYTTIAAVGPGICIIIASYSGCDTTLAVVWFILAMALMGSYYSGMNINPLDITPNYAGSTMGLVNGIAAISGIISPYLIGLLTPQSTLEQWRIAFWVCFAILVITNIVYVIFAKADQQWWDDVNKHGYPADWKHGPLPARSKGIEEKNKEETKDSMTTV